MTNKLDVHYEIRAVLADGKEIDKQWLQEIRAAISCAQQSASNAEARQIFRLVRLVLFLQDLLTSDGEGIGQFIYYLLKEESSPQWRKIGVNLEAMAEERRRFFEQQRKAAI